MKKRLYGSLNNRLDEGHIYNKDGLIHEGDDINLYFWSDVHCYFVEEVVSQKEIRVREYEVIADKSSAPYSQQWLYFKTRREKEAYLNDYYANNKEAAEAYARLLGKPYEPTDLSKVRESRSETWELRYGKWNRVTKFSKADIDRISKRDGWCRLCAKNEKEQKKLDEGKTITHYDRISEGISFGKGIRSYYYDYEF